VSSGLSNQPIQLQLTKCLDQLAALREEVRLQAHLAGMDANRVVDEVGRELEAIASEIASAGELARSALFERLRRVEEALANLARSVPGAV
jgi:hypothetical protein